ncbi:MAG: hypothetical protein NWP83_05450 [Spirosomaceae bacterium]|nr:hypothetical protein [Spirosomataceae bacterium]
MKLKSILGFVLVAFLSVNNVQAQGVDVAGLFDKALSLQGKGDNKAFGNALSMATGALETEAKASKTDFASKMLGQVGVLNKMLPLASKGMVKAGPLQKIISTVKMLIGANKISNMLGGGSSLIGQAAGLKSNLGLMKMGMSALGGGSKQDELGSLIGSAMGNVDLLGKGGLVAKKAEPALKTQLGGIMNLAKGLL